jgi:hypothetical protein
MQGRRQNSRHLCAEIITIRWTDNDGCTRSEVATLEDISARGACVQLEQSIPLETKVSLHNPKSEYTGTVKYCIYREFGYLLGIAFDDGYRWSKTDYQPSHLLELPLPDSEKPIPV